MSEKNFVNGLVVKRNEKAPAFVICSLSFKVGDFIKYMNDNAKNGWLNADVKLSQGGKYYAELNTWTKEEKVEEKTEKKDELDNYDSEVQTQGINPEDIPF